MKFRLNFALDNNTLYQYLFYIFLVLAPLINLYVSKEYNALNVLTVIFLGLGFPNKSKGFLLFFCTIVAIALSFFNSELGISTVSIRLLIFFTVAVISNNVVKQYNDVKKQKTDLVFALAKSLDSRDVYTAHHSENVGRYALKIAQEIKLPKEQCNAIFVGGLLHDIGKIGVPESILTKSSRLTNDEFEIIKLHPTTGYEILKHIPEFRRNGVLDMVLYHHERYDGKGYPAGLKGEEIPLVARIMSVADSFDAMTSNRVYRSSMNFELVLKEIKIKKGTQYDPEIADVFLSILEREGVKILSSNQEMLTKEILRVPIQQN